MFTLKPLPFEKNAFEPYISEKTMEFHHDKHHQTYVDNLNKLIKSTEFENLSLEEIIKNSFEDPDQSSIFNNAAQTYNHDFFWDCLSVKSENNVMSEKCIEAITESFGSVESFYEQFKSVALSQFGSGWAWLVKAEDGLEIIKTTNGDNPLTRDKQPLLTIDVWEHAYYLDYQNKRAEYVEAVMRNLFNWGFVDSKL